MSNAVTATNAEHVSIDTYRLRSTWLVALMCSPLPLACLLAAAGLRSARTLTDLLPHCPDPDATDVEILLHLAGHTTTPATTPAAPEAPTTTATTVASIDRSAA